MQIKNEFKRRGLHYLKTIRDEVLKHILRNKGKKKGRKK